MLELKSFSGAGGGGGGDKPDIESDNLRSRDTVEFVLGISEGRIKGLKDGLKSFFIGDIPLQAPDGSRNFDDFYVALYQGSEEDEPIEPALGGFARASTTVNVPVPSDGSNVGEWITRQTTTGDITAIDVRIVVQSLYRQERDGDVRRDHIDLRIEYKPLSSPTWLKFSGKDIRIGGKTTTTYVKEYRQEVDRIDEPYQVRVSQLNSNSTKYIRRCIWESFQEIDNKAFNLSNTAALHVVGRSTDQFSTIPQFSGIYEGLMCRVPSNYNPVSRTYSGTWDGTFKLAWTDDPAWILYEVVMNDRWGWAATNPDIYIDKYDCYAASLWCSERIPTGVGEAVRPRFSFNAVIQEPMQVREFARYIAGTFNAAMVDDFNGTVRLLIDKDDPAVALFTPESVVEGIFDYSYTDLSSWYNDITVSFVNPDLNWEVDRRRVYDQELIDKYGRIEHDFIAVGCTNESEAVMKAKYRLYTATTETEMVSFKTNRRGLFISPFDVILVADPDRGFALTGRITSRSGATVHFRDPIYLENGVTYKFKVNLPTGVIERNITTSTPRGSVTSVILNSALPSNTPENADFSIEAEGVAGLPKPYRVLKVEEGEHPDDITILASEINRQKWAILNAAEPGPEIDYSDRRVDNIRPPENLTIREITKEIYGQQALCLALAWQRSPSPMVRRYIVMYRRDDGPWMELTNTSELEAEFLNVAAGNYEFEVYAQSLHGRLSKPAEIAYIIEDMERVVPGLSNLRLVGQDGTEFFSPDCVFEWDVVQKDSLFASFQVTIRDSVTNEVRRTFHVQEPRATYFHSWNVSDGLARAFKVEVRQTDLYDNVSPAISETFHNDPVQIPGITTMPAIKGVVIWVDTPSEPDFAGLRIYMSETSGFTPGPDTLVYDGPDLTWRWDGKGVRYFRISPYDTFSKDDALVSAPLTEEAFGVVAEDIEEAQIRAIHIAANTIGQTHFADGLTPVGVVNGLPDPSEWDGPQIVTNEQDGKLYQIIEGEWQPVIADFELEDEMIENRHILDGAIDELKLAANAVTAAKIATGAVLEEKLANDAITAEKIRANAVSTEHLQDELITAEKLVANAVTEAKLAANAVTEEKLANAAVTAQKIAQGAIDATKFASGISAPEVKSSLPTTDNFEGRLVYLTTDGKLYRYHDGAWTAEVATADLSGLIQTGQLVNNAVTAAKLAANAVTAAKIATGAVLEEKLANAAVTMEKIRANAISTEHLQDELITAEKLVANAVTEAKLAANAVTQQKLANAAVRARHIAQGVVDATKFASGISAPEIKSTLPTTGNFEGRLVFLETDGKLYRYHDGGWTAAVPTTDLSGLIEGQQLVDEAITAVKLAEEAVEASKIKTGAVLAEKLAEGAVIAGKIAANAITTENLQDELITAEKLVAEAVTRAKIAGEAIDASKLATNAVTTAKVAANAINAAKIASNAVQARQIQANAVTTAKLADEAVQAAKLAANAVTEEKLANAAVTAQKIAQGAIDATKFASGISAPEVKSSLPTSGNFEGRLVFLTTNGKLYRYHSGAWTSAVPTADLSGLIQTAQLVDEAITAVKIATDAIDSSKIQAGAVEASKIAANAVVAGKIAANAVDTTQLAANAVTTAKLVNNAVNAAKIAANAVTQAKIAANAVTARQIAEKAIDATKFAQGISAPTVEDSLPTSGNYEGRLVHLTSDGQLYRYHNGSWTNAVPAINVTGQLTDDQIEEINAAKVAGQLTSDQIESIVAHKIDGQLTSAQIEEIEAAKIAGQLTDEQLAEINAAKIAGQLTDDQIAELSAGKITGQLTDEQIEGIAAAKLTGEITEVQISDDAITAPKLAANAVLANHISANAVIAEHITANAVGTDHLAANAVTARHLVVGDFTNLIPNGSFDTATPAGWEDLPSHWSFIEDPGAPTPYVLRVPVINSSSHVAYVTDAMPCSAGDKFYLSALARSTGGSGTHSTLQIYARYTRSDGTVWSDWGNLSPAVPEGETYVLCDRISTAPTNATFVRFAVRRHATDGTGLDILATAFQARRITPSVLIEDGAVSAEKLAANSVVAGKVAAEAITADAIAANAVTAQKIVANAIAAEHIAANAIGTNHLSANAITARELAIGDFTNIVPNPSFVDGTAHSWDAFDNWDVVEASEVPDLPTAPSRYVGIAPSGNTSRYTARANDKYADARPGDQFYFSVDVCCVGEVSPNSTGIRVGRLSRTTGAETLTTLLNFTPTGEWQRFEVTWTASTDFDGVRFGITRSANSDSGTVYFTNATMRRVNEGILLADGAVTAQKLSANAVEANHLSANAVTADALAANSVTAVQLSANAVEADKIAANAIETRHISADAIEAGAIAAGAVGADQIQANAIGSDQIAANAISAKQLVIGDFTNLIPNPRFEQNNTDGWHEWPSSWSTGSRTNRMPTRYSGRMSLDNENDQTAYIHDLPTVGGEKLYFAMAIASEGSSPREVNVQLVVDYYDQFGDPVSSETADHTQTNIPYSTFEHNIVVPEDATTMSLGIRRLAGGSGTGWFSNVQLRRIYGSTLIADGAITTEKVAANAINANHLSANSVTASQIAANAVTASQIAANAVKAVNIEANAVITAKIAANAVTTNEIATNAVKAAQIDAGAVTAGAIAANAIVAGKIDTGAVTADTIATNAVIAAKISANAVTAAKIASNAVQARQIQANAVNADKIAANSVGTDHLVANSVTAGQIAAGAVGADQIAANAISAEKIAANAVTAKHLAIGDFSNLVINPEFTDGSIDGWTDWPSPWSVIERNENAGNGAVRNAPRRFIASVPLSPSNQTATAISRLAINPGESLHVSFEAASGGSDPREVNFRISRWYYRADGTEISSTGTNLDTITGTSWSVRDLTFTAISDPEVAYVLVAIRRLAGGAGTGYFTNFKVHRLTPSVLIEDGAITTEKVAANAITANEISANAVTASQIAANAVTASQIAANAVKAVNIEANAVTTAKIAANAVTANEIATNAVKAAQIDAGAVTTGSLAAGAVTSEKIEANAITAREIAANAVTATQIAANAVTASQIAASAITSQKIAANAVQAENIAANAITVRHLAVGDFTNLIPNPRFADGSTDKWISMPSGWSVRRMDDFENAISQESPSEYYLRMESSDSTQWATIVDNLHHKPGDNYVFTVDHGGWGSLSGNLNLYRRWLDNDGNLVLSAQTNFSVGGNDWKTSTIEFTSPSDPAAVYLQLRLRRMAGSSGIVYLTNASLYRKARSTLIDEGAITSEKIAANAVTANEIAANAVTADQIATNAVVAAKIQANAVTAAKIASNAVQARQIQANAVTADAIAANSVGTDHLIANSVTAGIIAAGAVRADQIAANAVSAEHVAANAITARQLAIGDFTNIVPNPSFTDGTAHSWASFGAWDVVEASGVSGLPTAPSRYVGVFPGSVTSRTTTRASDKYTEARPGDIFYFSVDACRVGAISNNTARIRISRLNRSNGNESLTNVLTFNPTTSWQRYETTWTADAAYDGVRFGLTRETNSDSGTIYFTNATMRRVNEGILIADGAITAEKITANAIQSNHLSANSVTASQIAANAVVAASINANAVTTAKLAANAVTAAKIAANTITGNEIAANTIAGDKLIANAITTREITSSAVTAAQIAANAVTAVKIQANAVVSDKIQANAVVAAKVATNAIESRHVLANNITAAKIASNAIETRHLKADAITAGKIATGAVGADQIAANAITSDKIAANAITAKHIAIGDFENICKNPQFQGGNADGWDSWPSEWNIVARNPNAGTSAIRNAPTAYVAQATSPESGSIDAYIVRDLPIKAGERIYVSFDAASSGTSPTTVFRVRRYYRDAEGAGAGSGNTDFTRSGSAYTTYETSFTTTNSSAATVEISIRTLSSGTTTGYFTNVRVYKMTPTVLIEDGAITAEKITANAINSNHISANAIAANHLSANSVTASQIATNAVTTAKLAANAVTAAKIAASTITGNEIAANTIAGGKLIANTISTREIAASAVKAAQIDAGAVTAGKIAAGAVNASNILTNNIVVTDKINANAITAAKIASNAVQARQIQANAVNADKIAANSILTGHISTGAVNTAQLAANAITSDKIAANAITAKQIAIGDFENICKDPQFREGGAGWNSFPGQWNVIARGSGGSAPNSAPAPFMAQCPQDASHRDAYIVRNLPLKPGERIYVSVDYATGGSAPRNVHFQVRRIYRDADGVSLGSGTITQINGASSTGWGTIEGTFSTTDASLTAVDIYIRRVSGGSGTGYFTNVRVYKMTPTVLIEDGAITTEKITANAVVASKIAASAVTADKIATNAVIAAKIQANAVTAAKIASNAVQARQIQANAVTADKIAANAVTTAKLAANSVTAAKINVSSLSAISATIGTFQSASSGQRLVITDTRLRVYDNNGTERVRLGIW